MADWKCECGGTYQTNGGDYNPRDTKVYMKCDKIGGNIMQGTGKRIVKDTRLDTDSVITYAGTDILEIREVNY